jgi:hypothetical protein
MSFHSVAILQESAATSKSSPKSTNHSQKYDKTVELGVNSKFQQIFSLGHLTVLMNTAKLIKFRTGSTLGHLNSKPVTRSMPQWIFYQVAVLK